MPKDYFAYLFQSINNVLEQQVIESKRERDAEISEINAAIARLQFGAEAKAEHTSTITNSLQTCRWP